MSEILKNLCHLGVFTRQSLHNNAEHKNDHAIQAIQSSLNNQWEKVTIVLGPLKMIVKTLKTHYWL